MSKTEDLRNTFAAVWGIMGTCGPEYEHRFHPKRKWRFDVAFPESRVAVELEGGIWSSGRHTRPSGFVKDLEKYNTATLMGWRILRYTAADLKKRPGQVCEEVASMLVRSAGTAISRRNVVPTT